MIQSGWFKWYESEKDLFKSLDLEHLEQLFHREEKEEKQAQPAGVCSGDFMYCMHALYI